MPVIKTDNDFLADKVALRANWCPRFRHRPTRVLDVFGGRNVVWRCVDRQTQNPVDRTAIDNRVDLQDWHIHGDNRKILPSLDLDWFDVIDLDAYGVPTEQLVELFDRQFSGVVFVTFIQSYMGRIPNLIASDIGLPVSINAKVPSLVARRGWEYFRRWLALKGVTRIVHRSKNRKHYLAFAINGAELVEARWGSQTGGDIASPS